MAERYLEKRMCFYHENPCFKCAYSRAFVGSLGGAGLKQFRGQAGRSQIKVAAAIREFTQTQAIHRKSVRNLILEEIK